MEKVVKVSKDGASIDFFQSEKIPVSPKKFRSGPELEGFYRFIFENDLRREALAIIDRIYVSRKAQKKSAKAPVVEAAPLDPKQALKKAAAKAAADAKLAPVKVTVVPAKKAAAPAAKKPAAAAKAKKAPAAKKPAKKKK